MAQQAGLAPRADAPPFSVPVQASNHQRRGAGQPARTRGLPVCLPAHRLGLVTGIGRPVLAALTPGSACPAAALKERKFCLTRLPGPG